MFASWENIEMFKTWLFDGLEELFLGKVRWISEESNPNQTKPNLMTKRGK
jgi:hypothetical protein